MSHGIAGFHYAFNNNPQMTSGANPSWYITLYFDPGAFKQEVEAYFSVGCGINRCFLLFEFFRVWKKGATTREQTWSDK